MNAEAQTEMEAWRFKRNNPPRFDEGPIEVGSGPMTRYEFEGRVTYLFGPDWQTPLAKTFDYNERTFRRWLSGETQIPGQAAAAIRAMWQCKRHGLPFTRDGI